MRRAHQPALCDGGLAGGGVVERDERVEVDEDFFVNEAQGLASLRRAGRHRTENKVDEDFFVNEAQGLAGLF